MRTQASTFEFPRDLARAIGIDQAARLASAVFGQSTDGNFPPYSVYKTGADAYRIEIAVAGFSEDELTIETKEKFLIVKGEKAPVAEDGVEVIYRGIASRNFSRPFAIADYVEVKSAELKNGILTISLLREVPEAQKYRKIEIGKPTAAATTEAALETA